MALTTAGAIMIARALIGDSGFTPKFDNGGAAMGVGDSSTAFATSQTNLQAATNKVREFMQPGYPKNNDSFATGAVDFRAIFTTGEGNFVWNEWGIFNSGTGAGLAPNQSGGTMLSRKVEQFNGGVAKTSSESWQLTVTLTFSA